VKDSGNDCAWDAAQIAQLRALWGTGISTAEIGRRMGISKNAVVGKAHRIGLESLPSPIKRDGPPKRKRPRRAGAVTLAPVAAAVEPAAATPAPRMRAEPRVAARCQFLIGERPNWVACDAPAHVRLGADGSPHFSPYCPEHHALCYVGVPRSLDTREAERMAA
jgi:GcrA cell cycle regulator